MKAFCQTFANGFNLPLKKKKKYANLISQSV